ncbi:hypothetical protein [Planococcus halocryophilus]|uniref:hypothetical protein n=1 Tax=Planococcus halocryophilus TaxID=1215089 RepID=UPI001F0EE2E9|nr:hypothetical protein [Planococcus halocryophilus]MCH4825598.1 hypothetical protein [Planococcus halocryophilus]
MNNAKTEIENAVKKFRREVEKIKTSDNPYYHDAKVQEYEIKEKRAELDAFVAEQQNAFNASIVAEIEKAEHAAQHSRFTATEQQRKQGDYALDSYVADVTLARDDNGKHSAYKTLERRLDGMSAEELAHIRLQLPSVLARVNGDTVALKRLQSLNETLAALKTEEQERLDELKAHKVSGADGAYRRLRMIHPAYNDFRDNIARMKN